MATTPLSIPGISPFDAARDAIAHTRRHLFPIRFERWLVFGFVAFLDQCGRSGTYGGGGPGGNHHVFPWGGAGTRGPAEVRQALESGLAWLSAHAAPLVLGGLLVLVAGAAVVALVLWVNARGTFMYLDGVVTGRADVKRPWREHQVRADSYFVWTYGLAVAALLVLALAFGLVLAAVLAFARGPSDALSGASLLIAFVPVLVILSLVLPLLVLARVALRDFVAPLQVAAGVPCGEAVRLFERLLVAHPGPFVLYALLKLAFSVGVAIAVVLGGCLTCCVGFLPVVRQTLFQPLFYFERSWSVFLLRQMGYDVSARLMA